MSKILLASGSPRRREILTNLGFEVHTCTTNIDETPQPNESVDDYVKRMAVEKNQAAQSDSTRHILDVPILSADTVVALHNQILGKPKDVADAQRILTALSGCVHQVLTAVCVSYQEHEYACIQKNQVQFKSLTQDEIHAYIATGEPMDKAGAYGIQGLGGVFVANLSGSFTGVMGLPVFETMQLLQQIGWTTPPFFSS